ncbi:MAG: hypothetical protein LBH71_04045 [Oscillospiraceae bacterium]|jgi:phytol kinase|nr:hypothetical protein [Oscillospiraceae bacterium]
MKGIFSGVSVLLVLSLAMLITRSLKSRISAESTRKIIHITMGCTALSFPYIFDNKQSVVMLGIASSVIMLSLRFNKVLRENVGASLFGINRKSLGELYYIISIMIVFILHKSVVEYLIPILVLTFADSVAALVGIRYGKNNLAGEQEDKKSSEGSIMFFITAFTCVLVPLQLMTEIGRSEVLVISFLIGLLAAMVEVVSRNGNDNLLLPLLVYSFLRYNMSLTLQELLINFGIMVIFFVMALFVYRTTTISGLSAAYALLFGYVVFIQGGILWIVPPAAMMLTFGIMPMMKEKEKQEPIPYHVVEANVFIGLVCLWFSVFLSEYRDILYIAFSLSFACHLTLNTYHRVKKYRGFGYKMATFYSFAKSVVFIAVPTLIITGMSWLLFVIYIIFIFAAIPPQLLLRKKCDYVGVKIVRARTNEVLVGIVVIIFFAVGRLV